MRVLQVIDSLPSTSGGARFVGKLVQKLVERKIDCHLLLIDGANSHFLDELHLANIKIISLDINVKNRYRFTYVRKIAALMAEYDIVHVHIFPASYLVAFASLFTKYNIPIVFTEHNAYNRRATHKVFKFAEKFVYSRFSKIVGISSAVEFFIKSHLGIRGDKIEVIDNGVDFNSINNSSMANRSDFNLSPTDIILLMSARFADQKDQGTVIRALAGLPENYKLLFAGDGPNLEKYRKYAEDLGVLPRVRFLGSRSDIFQIIKMSDVNILSSHYEGFGLSAVEAMSAAKPIIATNVPGVAEVVEGAGLLFNVGDHEKLTSLLFHLGTDRLFYNDIAERCFERSKLYDIEIMTDKYIKVYEAVLKENNGN
ncbi:glycosyltransferase [Kaistella polysaccharea]|uniref:glycosyltransferase n=1 Tax=Kaistella polysaccharea TaxID=2878534 RepID=UPI001CF42C84|nr:glycosyltransferase [Kaistella polysaccharea]